ncbi:MAG: outer membrane protein assembly factor BamB [Wenzhouxiangellaceae bacterium]|nr:outer membrane protein assembly factor BamB [Wenzhouxiangellaceae bacterium]
MKPFARIVAIAVTILLISGCSLFGEKDPERDPLDLVDFDSAVRVEQLWSTSVGAGVGRSAPALKPYFADGRIWTADYKGRIEAVDAQSGRRLKLFDTEFELSAGPAVFGNRVMVGTFNGQIVVLDRESGEVQWRAQLSSEILAAPELRDGIIMVRCIDGRVFGLNAETGIRLWVYDRSVPLLTLRGNSPLSTRAGQLFVGHDDGTVTALRQSDGNLLWEQRVSVPEGRTQLDRLADIDGPMAIVGLDLYSVSRHGRVASLALDSGRLLWSKELASHSGLTVSRTQLALADTSDKVWVLDRRSGGTLWENDQLLRRKLSRPVFHGDFVVVADVEGYLHWMDSNSGEFAARKRASGNPPAAAPLVVGDTLYLLDNNGKLSAWRLGAAS